MSLGKRRSKLSRANLRPTQTTNLQQERRARRREQAVRIGLFMASVLAAAALVHGSGVPFPYRVGQRPTRDIRVNVAHFDRRNPIRTNANRQAAADAVAPVMRNDPAPIEQLRTRLDDLIEGVAKAPNFAALPETFKTTWKLTPALFEDLREASDTPERRDGLKALIGEAFEPLIRDGVLGPDTLPRTEDSSSYLSVYKLDEDPTEARQVQRERVIPERLTNPQSPVAKEFAAKFTNPTLGAALYSLVSEKLAGTPTLTFEEAITTRDREAARDAVPDEFDSFSKGELLVEQDTEISEEQLILLRLEHEEAVKQLSLGLKIQRGGAIFVIVAALFALIGYYIQKHELRLWGDQARMAQLSVLVVLTMAVVRMLAGQTWDAELIPVAITAMILAVAFNPHFALVVSFALCLCTSLAMGAGLGHFIVLMGGTAGGVLLLNDVRTRTKLIKVGGALALGYFILTWATGLWQNQAYGLIATDSLWRAGWGLMAGFFLGGSLPFIENAFGIVTGISLLELGDITHPLLQELVRRAPGTHNHSITVGTIAEAAAERVGANALLVRIGAYFHDIGKMLKPHYFIENQAGGVNRHSSLAPAMSTLIIIGHVKDGVDLGHQHHLPEPIIDLIEQHHGTTLVEYFYHEANRRNGQNPDASALLESAFRYPGPKPQTKEAAILMISDAVESASRTLSEPTSARIEGLVTDLMNKRLHDGQFDECGLTLREIGEIRESLIKSLIGIYHGRVKYPEQRTA